MKKIITSPEEFLKQACLFSSGRGLGCSDQMGGAKYFFIANYDSAVENQFIVTTKEVSATPTLTVYRYDLEDGNGGAVSTINKAVDAGTRFYEEVITVNLNTIDAAMQEELDNLTAGKAWCWIGDYNGNVMFYGHENGCDCTGGQIDTGVAKADRSGYQIIFTAKERLSFPLNIAYTLYPFDTLPDVTVDPPFIPTP
jgi:hypothetical protein